MIRSNGVINIDGKILSRHITSDKDTYKIASPKGSDFRRRIIEIVEGLKKARIKLDGALAMYNVLHPKNKEEAIFEKVKDRMSR